LKKKLFLLLAGAVISSMVLGGCNNKANDNDNRDNSPLRINNPMNPQDDRNFDNDFNRNDINDDNMIDRDNDLNNNDINNNYRAPSKDKNTDTDKDIIKDSNTKHEDIIEDDIDRNDRDNLDE
jgi:hypothetical protein